MERAFPDAMVDENEALKLVMLNHPEDRHVGAAAVTARARPIVTSNLKGFRQLPAGVPALRLTSRRTSEKLVRPYPAPRERAR